MHMAREIAKYRKMFNEKPPCLQPLSDHLSLYPLPTGDHCCLFLVSMESSSSCIPVVL